MTKLLSEQPLISGKVKKTPPSQVSADRYQWIKIQDTEPSFGIPPENNSFIASNTNGDRTWLFARQGLAIDGSGNITVDEDTLPIDSGALSYSTSSTLHTVLEDIDDVITGIESIQETLLDSVATDSTISGDGTATNPLSVGQPVGPNDSVTFTGLQVDNININGNRISSTDVDGDVVLDPDGTGVVSVSGSRIVNLKTPSAPADAVTKQYVDDNVQGLRTLPSADAFVDFNLSATYDNGTDGVGATLTATANGAFPTVDGVSVVIGDNIIINGQANRAHNGSYTLTTLGDSGSPWVLTRADFSDSAEEQAGSFEFVTGGVQYENTGWVMTVQTLPVVMGTTELEWVQFSGAGTYSAGTGLDLDGTVFSNTGVLSITATNNLSVNQSTGNITIRDNGTSANTSGALVERDVNGDFSAGTITADLTGNARTATALETSRNFTVTGAVATSVPVSFNGTSAVILNVTQQNNSVTLGTHTVGDYVADVVAGTGIAVAGSPGEGTVPEVSLSHLGLETLSGANSDRIFFWDYSTGSAEWLTIGTGLGITNNTINNTKPAFGKIQVSGQSDVDADDINDTLTVVGGDNISVTTDADTDTITINSGTTGDSAFETIVTAVGSTATTVIDAFSMTNFRSAKYYVQISQNGDYQISELLVVHNAVVSNSTEYAVLDTAGELGVLSTSVNGSTIEISITMNNSTVSEIRMKRLLLET